MFDHFANEDDDYEDIGDLDFIMNIRQQHEEETIDEHGYSINDFDNDSEKMENDVKYHFMIVSFILFILRFI